MRIAILSDIHGNVIALDAVLADIQRQGTPDLYWVLGDLIALGSDPVAVLERLRALRHAQFTCGNTDRYVLVGDLPGLPLNEAAIEPAAVSELIMAARTFAWTLGTISAAGHRSWLVTLPLEQRLTLPDSTRLLGVHASPGRDDGPGIHPGLTDDELAGVLAPSDADLVFVGHTHVPLDRTAGGGRVVNLGSVSNPVTTDLRASYVLLDADEHGYHIGRRRVEYDRAAALTALETSGNPSTPFISQFLRGERRSPWATHAEADTGADTRQ